jgi:aminomethyltransferase
MIMPHELFQTPLCDWHRQQGGRLVDFAGWSMPVQYTSIKAEHQATRTGAGLFDISHMGRLTFHGARAAKFLDSVVTRRVMDMKPGAIRYGLIVNHDGGILDDVLVYHVPGIADSDYQMVVNAGNRDKIVDWLTQQANELGFDDVQMIDRTAEAAMIAVQGPAAVGLMTPLLSADLASAKYYTGQLTEIAGHTGMVSRTGYTGEDGCELVVGAADALSVWQAVLDQSGGAAVACGLGCRDTLRLEAAMPLYGHELTEQVNPVQAGLRFAYNLEDRKFVGHEAIRQFEQDDAQLHRIGLQFENRRVPREGYVVYDGDRPVGKVTSGTFSPTLNRPITMAYVEPSVSQAGTRVAIDVRGNRENGVVVELPFYRRS